MTQQGKIWEHRASPLILIKPIYERMLKLASIKETDPQPKFTGSYKINSVKD